MAVRHGLAGQWAKSKADRTFRQMISLYMAVLFVWGLCMGFWLAKHRDWLGWLVFGGGLVLVALSQRLLDRPAKALAKERIRYLRGAQSEALVAWLLEDLPDDWHVFNGMKLVADWDIDHVVVGPGGLFSVSTKGYRGLIGCGDGGRLTYNNEATELLRQTTGQAMQLRNRLQAMLGNDVPFVQAVLAVPFAFIECPRRQGAVLVVHQDELLDTIEQSKKKLSTSQIERFAKVLDMLQQSAAHLYRRADRTPPSIARLPQSAEEKQ